MYTLILITTQTFLGQYNSLESCNQAIRAVYEKQMIPYPDALSKEMLDKVQKLVDNRVKYQREYVCVKQ
jgi:hypothetical protein